MKERFTIDILKIMRIIVIVFKVSTILFCGVLIYFMLSLMSSYKKEMEKEQNYTLGNATHQDRQAIINTLSVLQQGYYERDVTKIDYYTDKTIDTTSIVILGTNPNEILIGKEGVQRLLYGDWKFWGDVKFNLDKTHVSVSNNTAYFALTGTIKIDVWKMNFPLRITGVMVKDNSKWLINKLQFQYDFNTNYIIFGLIASVLSAISFVILIFSIGVSIVTKRIQRTSNCLTL